MRGVQSHAGSHLSRKGLNWLSRRPRAGKGRMHVHVRIHSWNYELPKQNNPNDSTRQFYLERYSNKVKYVLRYLLFNGAKNIIYTII